MRHQNYKLFSPAKINLFLRVLSKRSDGYHEIASLFQAVGLGDYLSFSENEKETFTSSDPNLPLDEKNLVIKAANLFRQKTGVKTSLAIHLEKHIPMQAGLGGGSSNAATTLYALNTLFGHVVDESELQKWGSELGSDVAFFFSSGTAFCEGRGERVTSLPPLNLPRSWFLVKIDKGLSTPKIYEALDRKTCSKTAPEKLLSSFLKGDIKPINDLEKPAFALLPELTLLKNRLEEQGFIVFLTGSGTGLVCVGSKIPAVDFPVKWYPLSFLHRKKDTWYG